MFAIEVEYVGVQRAASLFNEKLILSALKLFKLKLVVVEQVLFDQTGTQRSVAVWVLEEIGVAGRDEASVVRRLLAQDGLDLVDGNGHVDEDQVL